MALGLCPIGTAYNIPAGEQNEGAEPAGSAPLNASVRTAGLLVAAEVGHGLVQARAADAHERQEHQAGCQGDAQASNQPGSAPGA